jgi:hypothetical protein
LLSTGNFKAHKDRDLFYFLLYPEVCTHARHCGRKGRKMGGKRKMDQ